MHKLITQALPIEGINGPLPELVQDGQYSRFWTHNGENLENNWEGIIVPGMEGTMKMWPNYNLPPAVLTCPGPHKPPQTLHPPSWPVPRPEHERRRRLKGKELEQAPSEMKEPKLPSRARIQRVSDGTKKETKERGQGILIWMAGGPLKKESKESKQGVSDWIAGEIKKELKGGVLAWMAVPPPKKESKGWKGGVLAWMAGDRPPKK
jgi:hypothetical protein